MFKFNRKYLLLALLLFIIEVIIAVFVNDKFVRPIVGDFLVVILIYCFVKAFFNIPVIKAAVAVLIFAYTVEILQYFKVVKLLGLQKSKLANIIIGNTFQWGDLVAYTLGILLVIFIEHKVQRNNKNTDIPAAR